jgi:hypothetical protein
MVVNHEPLENYVLVATGRLKHGQLVSIVDGFLHAQQMRKLKRHRYDPQESPTYVGCPCGGVAYGT